MSVPKTINEKLRYLDQAMALVREEYRRAMTKHPNQFVNAHEGYAVLLEEVDELWDHVKVDSAYTALAMKEAVQIAAMAVKFIVELHDHEKGDPSSRLQLASTVHGLSQGTSPRTHLGKLAQASGDRQ